MAPKAAKVAASATPESACPQPYDIAPPAWRPPLHSSAATQGYPDFFPPRAGQKEDILSENVVKNGFNAKPIASNESFSAHGLIINRINNESVLDHLSSLFTAVLARREAIVPSIAAHFHPLPARVTLNDAKRQAYIRDLADSSVPLSKLSARIPHGFKGAEALEMLWTGRVEVERAVWFVRALGGNEIAATRHRQNFPQQYTVDWTKAVAEQLTKQLSELPVPSPTSAPKAPPKPSPADLALWVTRFAYFLDLLRAFVSQGLVDRPTLLRWALDQVASVNLARLEFVLFVVEDTLESFFGCEELCSGLVRACAGRLKEARGAAGAEHIARLDSTLVRILQTAFLAAPDSFVSPKLWLPHCTLLTAILHDTPHLGLAGEPRTDQLVQALRARFDDVRMRNEALVFGTPCKRDGSPRKREMRDIEILDSITHTSHISDVASTYFSASPSVRLFPAKLGTLLVWAVTPSRSGAHRAYAAASLLDWWRRAEPGRAPAQVQQDVFAWLDRADVVRDEANARALAQLMGELVRKGLFSYGWYLQRLMARGESEEPGRPSVHFRILRNTPLFTAPPSLVNQRRVVLYGVRVSGTQSTSGDAAIRRELRRALPRIFDRSKESVPLDPAGVAQSFKRTASAPLFDSSRVVRTFLLSAVYELVEDSGVPLETEELAIVVAVLELIKDYSAMRELILFFLARTTDKVLLFLIMETARRHWDVWVAMDTLGQLIDAVSSKHHALRSGGSQLRPLLLFLVTARELGHLSDELSAQLDESLIALDKSLRLSNPPTQPPAVVPEVLRLATDPSPAAPQALATTLWYKHSSFPDWGLTAWSSTVEALRNVAAASIPLTNQQACVYKYARFLAEVNSHIPDGLEAQLVRWLADHAKLGDFSSAFAGPAAPLLVMLLRQLVVLRCVATMQILDHLYLPVLQRSAVSLATPHFDESSSCSLTVAHLNILLLNLLAPEAAAAAAISIPDSDTLPRLTLPEVQHLETRRTRVYRSAEVLRLAHALPLLTVHEEYAAAGERTAASSEALRRSLGAQRAFCAACCQDIDAVHDIVLQDRLGESELRPGVKQREVETLRMILSDETSPDAKSADPDGEWQSILGHPDPWRFSRLRVALRLLLNHLGPTSNTPNGPQSPGAGVPTLAKQHLYPLLSSPEADLVADILRGMTGVAAEEFANLGMDGISEALANLSSLSLESEQAQEAVPDLDGKLNIMANVLLQPRRPLQALPPLRDDIVQRYLGALAKCFALVYPRLLPGSAEEDGMEPDEAAPLLLRPLAVVLARLLHLVLRCSTSLSASLKERASNVLCHIMRAAEMLDDDADEAFFNLLLDTASSLLAELNPDARASANNVIQGVLASLSSSSPSHDRPISSPNSRRTRLSRFLPPTQPDGVVQNLILTPGHGLRGRKAQARNWEWFDSAAPTIPPGIHPTLSTDAVPNTGPISLAVLGSRRTRDRLPSPSQASAGEREFELGDPHRLDSERTYGDDLGGDPVYARHFRRGLVLEAQDDDERSSTKSRHTTPAPRSRTPGVASAASPSALSVVSPSQPTPSVPESTSTTSTRRGTKRKASVGSASTASTTTTKGPEVVVLDDDDEPPAAPPAKKARGKAAETTTTTKKGGRRKKAS